MSDDQVLIERLLAETPLSSPWQDCPRCGEAKQGRSVDFGEERLPGLSQRGAVRIVRDECRVCDNCGKVHYTRHITFERFPQDLPYYFR